SSPSLSRLKRSSKLSIAPSILFTGFARFSGRFIRGSRDVGFNHIIRKSNTAEVDGGATSWVQLLVPCLDFYLALCISVNEIKSMLFIITKMMEVPFTSIFAMLNLHWKFPALIWITQSRRCDSELN